MVKQDAGLWLFVESVRMISTQSRYTGALNFGVECRSWIVWRVFVPLREERHFCAHLHVQIGAPGFQVPQGPALGQAKYKDT